MEIKQLALIVTDQDLNQIARRHLPKDFPVADLEIRITPEGMHIQGKYPLLVHVPFETLWELEVVSGKINAKLAKAKALGLPVTVFINMFMKLIHDAFLNEPWLDQEQKMLIIDVEKLLEEEGFNIRMNLRNVHASVGRLFVEASDGSGTQGPVF
jgi:hypothetical protein